MPRLYAALGAAVVVLGLVAWALCERGEAIAATARADAAERVARANAEAVEAMRQDRAATVAALTGVARDIAERAAQSASIRRSVYAAPTTTACLDSPAVRAALDGLRAAGTGGAARDSGAARRAAGMQPAPAPAR